MPPFFTFLGVRTNGKQGKCGHTCYFCIPVGLQKRLLGSLPKPGFGTSCPKVDCLRHRCLSLLFLILALVGHTQQMVDIGLDRHGLPHPLLRLPVVRIQRLFLRRQSAALFF